MKRKSFNKQHGGVKRIFGMMLVFAMVLTMVSLGKTNQVKAEEPESEAAPVYITVHVSVPENWGWTRPGLWFKNIDGVTVVGSSVEKEEVTGWGGECAYQLTDDGDGFYSITVKASNDTLSAGIQTVNLDDPNGNSGGVGYKAEMAAYTGENPTDVYIMGLTSEPWWGVYGSADKDPLPAGPATGDDNKDPGTGDDNKDPGIGNDNKEPGTGNDGKDPGTGTDSKDPGTGNDDNKTDTDGKSPSTGAAVPFAAWMLMVSLLAMGYAVKKNSVVR